MSKLTEATDAERRYFAKISKNEVGCWRWLGKIDRDGFPRFMVSRRDWFVHRWAYTKFVGPLSDQSRIKQTCGDKTCVNPDHLQMILLHDDLARFHSKYRISDSGCWEWTDEPNSGGYGTISINCEKMGAHRYSYEVFRGPIPEGLELDHTCRNRICVNPDHLDAVTHKVNVNRGEAGAAAGAHNRVKMCCPQGHPYDDANCRINKAGSRVCKICARDAMRRHRLRRVNAHLQR